jgi:hypothetical protein
MPEIEKQNFGGVKWRPAGKAEKLTTICEPIVYIMWDL